MTPQVNRRSNHDWIWEVHAGHSPWHLGRRAFHFPISQRVESDFFFAHIFWDWIEKDNRKITLGFKWHLYFCPFLDSRLRAISRHFLRPSSNGPPTDPPQTVGWCTERRSTSTCAQGTESMRQTFMQGTQACVWMETRARCLGYQGILLMATRNPVNSPVEVGSLSHYLQRFMHARWLFRISSINNMTGEVVVLKRLFLFVFEWIFFL